MKKNLKTPRKSREVILEPQVKAAIDRMYRFLIEKFDLASQNVALVGVRTRGVILANRLHDRLQADKGFSIPVGAIDITLYRDDFSSAGVNPEVGETTLDFDVNEKTIVLVDDVLFTGRTIRAALDVLIDFGRPESVRLITLVDRGHRELPITADFAALTLATKKLESVAIHLSETDGREEILIFEASDKHGS